MTKQPDLDAPGMLDPPGRRNWGRILLLPVLIALGIAAVFVFHVDRYLTFDALAANRSWLIHRVAEDFLITVLEFTATYIVATTLSLPGSFIFTMAAGFLFGPVLGTAIAVTAATAGATLLFAIARTSLGELLRNRSQGALRTLKEGFAKNAFSYLLFLRLVPVFPFWLINLAAAFFGVPLRTFVLATFAGIIPGAAVYASIGSGLGSVLDRGQKPDLSVIFSPAILLPMLALAALSLTPIAYRRLRRH